MFTVHGLHGHIARNNAVSLGLLSLFVVAMCALWCVVAFWGVVVIVLIGMIAFGFMGNSHLVLWALDLLKHPGFIVDWMVVPLVVSALLLGVGLTFLRRIIRHLTRARSVERRAQPRLYTTVENLSLAAGIPMPRIEIIERSGMNAYATGLSPLYATLAVTSGLLERLSPNELEAVLAHEISHIKNRDTRVMAIAALFGGLISMVSELLWSHYLVRSATLNDTFQVRGDAEDGRATADEQYRRVGRMFAFIGVILMGPIVLLAVDAVTTGKGDFRGLTQLLACGWLIACVRIGFKDHIAAVWRGDLETSSLKPLAVGLGVVVCVALVPMVRPWLFPTVSAFQAVCPGQSFGCMVAHLPSAFVDVIISNVHGLKGWGTPPVNVRPFDFHSDIVVPLILGIIAMIALMIYGASNPTAEVLRYWGEQRAVLKHDRSAPLKPQTEYLIIFPFWVLNLMIGTILVVIYAGAALLQGAVTRPREYMADAGALELIKDPQPLVSALRRISSQQSNDPVPAAFLATLISGPSIGWLATHPNVEDRVTALRTFGTGRDVEDAVSRRAEGVAPMENPGAAARPARSARIVQGLSSLPPSLTRG